MKPASLIACIGLILFGTTRAPAGVIITVSQVGSDVEATGSGTLDTTSIPGPFLISRFSETRPDAAFIDIGPTAVTNANTFIGITGPSTLGPGNPISQRHVRHRGHLWSHGSGGRPNHTGRLHLRQCTFRYCDLVWHDNQLSRTDARDLHLDLGHRSGRGLLNGKHWRRPRTQHADLAWHWHSGRSRWQLATA